MYNNDFRILVALQNPETEDALVSLAATVASISSGVLYLTHVLQPKEKIGHARQIALSQSATKATECGVTAQSHLLKGNNVTQIIKEAAQRWKCNMMVMGWYGDVNRQSILSSENRALTKSVEIDTLIFKNKGFHRADRVVVPTGGGPNSFMGLQVAADLANTWNAKLHVIRVARNKDYRPLDPIFERYCRQVYSDTESRLNLLGITATIEVVPDSDVVEPIVSRAKKEDFFVLGASNDWQQEEFLAGSIPDQIAFEAPCSVLMVRSKTAPNGLLSSVFFENTIRLHIKPKDKWNAISQMVDVLVEERQIPSSQRNYVLNTALDRERKSSTGIGHETAIPHAPIANLPGIIGVFAMCHEGIDFGASDGELVRYIFLLLTPQQNYRGYIPILSQIAALMRSEKIRAEVINCHTPAELTNLIKKRESVLG